MPEMIRESHERQVVLGKEAENQEYVKKIDGVAENILKQNVLNPKTEIDKKSQYGRAEYLVNSLGGQGEFRANSVEGLKNVLKDDEKTETQKEIAEERLSILEKGVFIVMRWGGDEKLQDLLGKGSAVEIDNELPIPFKGLGERVVRNIISNEVILGKLRDLDDIRENCDLDNPKDRELMSEEISQAYADLTRIRGLNPDEKEQLKMVKAYLNAKMQTMDDDSRGSENKSEESEIVNELRRARELEEDRIAQKRKEEEAYAEARKRSLEEARFETFQAMLLHKNPITLDVFQQYAPEWMKEERDKPLMQTLVALANSCFYKWKYGDTNLDVMVDPRGEATFNAPNEMMKKMYEIPGVRQTMESIVNTFFEPGEEKGIGLDGKEKKVFVFRLKGTSQDKKIKERKIKLAEGEPNELSKVLSAVQNIGDEQARLVELLESQGLKKSDAMLAVSTAFNLLYVGHVFEDADIDKKLKPCDAYVEQMRAFMFPATKARSKFGLNDIPVTEKNSRRSQQKESVGTEEGWGGQLGQWLTEVVIRARHKIDEGVSENDPDIQFYRQYQRGEVHPFPERLFASFFTLTEVMVEEEGNKTGTEPELTPMSLAEALYLGRDIIYEAKGKGVNPWGSYYDASDSANKLYKIVKGDQKSYPLPLGDDRNFLGVASWVHEVSDARKKVRGQEILKPHVGNAEFVKWIIAACVQGGIYPYSAELVLMTPDVGEDQDISFDGLLKRRDLLEDDKDKKWLKKEFHAENFGSRLTRMRIIKRIGKRR